MPRYVALLRGVNVSGRRRIKMAELRDLFGSLGFTDVETYAQSGNVVFSTTDDRAGASDAISGSIAATFGYTDVTVLVRNERELADVVDHNPFVNRGDEIKCLHVTFLGREPDAAHILALDPRGFLPDEFAIAGQDVFVFCLGGYGRTKLNSAFFERKLAVPATTRSAKTVQRLLEMIRS